ncbi:MAG: glycosyltransferase [Alicyclobacillus sp.]|nr:glycosyltransferase [Alicyclobacillus sp.]
MISLRWEGPLFSSGSLAHVNRALCRILSHQPDISLSITPRGPEDLPRHWFPELNGLSDCIHRPLPDAAFHVRHQWPPNFTPPAAGRWILFQPWEFGAIPRSWVAPVVHEVDEVWVNSRYTRDMYLRSGVPADKVFSFPLGFDPDVYSPAGPKRAFGETFGFTFLFVGGTIARKGIDILLEAYRRAFSRGDDVCLVIKDYGVNSFYRGQTHQEAILRFASDPSAPRILYLTEELSPAEMAALYRACDCLVHPYRGEGFGLPILEAMACGLPVIVPDQGPATEFTTNECALYVPSRLVQGPNTRNLVSDPVWIETDAEALARTLAVAAKNKTAVSRMGERACGHAHRWYTWEKAALHLLARLRLHRGAPPLRSRPTDWLSLAKRYRDMNNWEAVHHCATRAQAHPAARVQGRLLLAESLLHMDRAGEAVTLLTSMADEVTKRAPDPTDERLLAEWHYGLALGLYQLHRYLESKSWCEKGMRWDKSSRFQTLHAEVLKRIQEHQRRVEQALQAAPLAEQEGEGGAAERRVRPVARTPHPWFRPGECVLVLQGGEVRPLHLHAGGEAEGAHEAEEAHEMKDEVLKDGVAVQLEVLGLDLGNCPKFIDIQPSAWAEHLFRQTRRRQYDGIVLDHVLERVPVEAARQLILACRQALAADGRLVVYFSDMDAAHPGSFWDDERRIRPYSKTLVCKLVRGAGLRVAETSCSSAGADEQYVVAREVAVPLLWESPVLNASGYASENQVMLQGLRSRCFTIQLRPRELDARPELYTRDFVEFVQSCAENVLSAPVVHVQNVPAYGFVPSSAPVSIGRTMFETDRLPEDWVWKCNQLSEIWVPSSFNVDTFARSGVHPFKLRVIPEPFDFEQFRPASSGRSPALPADLVPPLKSFVFFSNFAWNYRKGWDILVRAFIEEFDRDEDVCLLVKTTRMEESADPHADILKYIHSLGKSADECPVIRVIDAYLDEVQLKSLYELAHAFVLPTRGEGWGRPFVEAMAMEIPVIGTRWGGHLDFLNDHNSFLIDIEGLESVDERMHIPFYRGHRWASPSVQSARRAMREVYRSYDAAKERARRGRRELAQILSPHAVAELITNRIVTLLREYRDAFHRPGEKG